MFRLNSCKSNWRCSAHTSVLEKKKKKTWIVKAISLIKLNSPHSQFTEKYKFLHFASVTYLQTQVQR